MPAVKKIRVIFELEVTRIDGPPASREAIGQGIGDFIDGQEIEVQDPDRDDVSVYQVDVLNVTEATNG